MIDKLIDDLGSGLNESSIRNRLIALREQAEALDSQLNVLQARLDELEANAQKENVPVDQDRLEEVQEKFLKALFDYSAPLALSMIANPLGISKGVSEYHRDVLFEKEMIWFANRVRTGTDAYILSPKGRAYVVKYLLR